jgi:tryptophanyl-tRNA synthetase
MSTTAHSEQGTVYVLDEPEAIERKFKRAVTDSGAGIVHDRKAKPGVSNLLDIYAAARRITIPEAEAAFADARGYGDLKAGVAEAVIARLTPVRERALELRGDEAALEEALAVGAEKARAIAAGTVADVRARMGVGPG